MSERQYLIILLFGNVFFIILVSFAKTFVFCNLLFAFSAFYALKQFCLKMFMLYKAPNITKRIREHRNIQSIPRCRFKHYFPRLFMRFIHLSTFLILLLRGGWLYSKRTLMNEGERCEKLSLESFFKAEIISSP